MDTTTAALHARHDVRISGRGPTLVYAHGFGCSQAMWGAILPAFASTHRQMAFDHAGSGRSSHDAYDPVRHATLDGYADDVIALCRSVAPPEGVTLVTHSVSCSIGLIAAAREPALFRDLVLIGPNPCLVDEPPDYIGGFRREDLDALMALMDQNYLGWANTLAGTVAGEGGGAPVAGRLADSFCSTDPVITRRFAMAALYGDHRAEVARVRTPSLVLQHRHDALAPMAVGEWLVRHLPDSTLEVLEVHGHCAHMSHPGLVVDAMRRRFHG